MNTTLLLLSCFVNVDSKESDKSIPGIDLTCMHSIVPVLIPLLLFHCKRVDITDLYYLVRPTFAEDQMSLFPEENVLTKEIESWKAFADSLKTDEEKKYSLKC